MRYNTSKPMDRRYLHHLWTRIRPINPGYLLAAFLICSLVYLFALRANNAGMVVRRNAVYTADQKGVGVEQALQDLRAYVGNHMNTNLDDGHGVYPPIQLKYTYERLVQAEQTRVTDANAQIYTAAQKYCETLDPNSVLGRSRVPCIEAYIKSHGTVNVRTIPDALYKFDFVSPRWSPDLAGWNLVLAAVFLVLTILRLLVGRLLRHFLK